MMGRLMAFIVVVVCTAQVVLLRAQERTEEPRSTLHPRFAHHKIDDGYLRLDLRSGEVATCRSNPGGWTCTLAPEERSALENEIARLQRDNAGLKNALLGARCGVALGHRHRGADPPRRHPPARQRRSRRRLTPASTGRPRSTGSSPTMERWWRRVVELAADDPA